MSERRDQFDLGLYVVTDERVSRGCPTVEVVAAAIRGGADAIQLRSKELTAREQLALGREFRALTRDAGVLLILNDRADLALALDADGVHVGQDDLPVDKARAIVGPERIVGTSTHSAAQVDAADGSDADYYAAGPVFETPTKQGRPATGWDLIAYAAGRATKPWFAIGGMDAATARQAAAVGAERVVVVRAIRDADDPEAAARDVRAAIETERHVGAAQ